MEIQRIDFRFYDAQWVFYIFWNANGFFCPNPKLQHNFNTGSFEEDVRYFLFIISPPERFKILHNMMMRALACLKL